MKTKLSLSLAILVSACGGYDGKLSAADDVMPHAIVAADAINALFGCDLVELSAAAPGKWHDGVSEVRFSDGMLASFDGFTHVDADALKAPGERDILVRRKPELERDSLKFHFAPPNYAATIVHELGHAFGLQHITGDNIMNINSGDITNAEQMATFKRSLEYVGVTCKGKQNAGR